MSEAAIVGLVKFCIASVVGCVGFVLTIMNYNKRKIEEAREQSVGAEALKKLEKEIAEIRKEHDEFKKDIFEMIFKNR